MNKSEYNKLKTGLDFLEDELLPRFGENTSLGTIIRNYKSRIKHYANQTRK